MILGEFVSCFEYNGIIKSGSYHISLTLISLVRGVFELGIM